ncbi:MAG TPA: pyridoxamine 5'-phosphate oxidase family protein [Actinomycetota bacterium]
MHETTEDLNELQELLDRSRARGGSHLRSIFTKVTEMSAVDVVVELSGVQVLNLATVTASGAPRVAPVDGLFYRGRFYFGSAHESVRFKHIRARPQVSAAHTRGEDLTVIVHGVAVEIDVSKPEQAGFRSYLLELYPEWESSYAGDPPPCAFIDAEKMFAARVSRLREG